MKKPTSKSSRLITYLQFFLFIAIPFGAQAQVKGTVKDSDGNPLPFVNIYIENTYIGTTSNHLGHYEIGVQNRTKVSIIYQYLGFKTQKHTLEITTPTLEHDVVLIAENYNLSEVVLSSKENPANAIIRKAIASRKSNSDKTGKFTADFYSKGIFKLKNMPKKILGKEVGDFGGALDSSGTGIIYLSETVSKITFEKPNQLKERIIASKISGNSNGFSYNTAQDTRFDFYDNTINMGALLISPIADNAFSYYKYSLEGTFYDEYNHLINKIKVTAKRDMEPVFEGYLFIVEDSWAIYGVALQTKGYRMKAEFLNSMQLNQNFSYNPTSQIWAKNVQTLSFDAGAFGIVFNGNFTHVFSNYVFKEEFAKKTFTRELVSFEEHANKKDNAFWDQKRPVPLTEEELKDYTKKDSIQTLRKSKPYLDSLDSKKNAFKLQKLLTGYSYRNSFENWRLSYAGILKLVEFNTVQGWNIATNLSYVKREESTRKYSAAGANFNYGFSEKKFRATAYFTTRLNEVYNSNFTLNGGSQVAQFNASQPISNFINTIASLGFKNNFMKLYEKNFIRMAYSQEATNGLFLYGSLEYAERSPLFNTTEYSMAKRHKNYTANNPLDPFDFTNAGFEKHNLIKGSISTQINFGQYYFSRPDGKFNLRNNRFPTLYLGYEKGFAGNQSNYHYDLVSTRIYYDQTLSNKGTIAINTKAGTFFNAENISFVDYKHFNGNQTHINTSDRYLNVFNLLPYYTHSTNTSYWETHVEHDFNGFITNQIPLLNKLKSSLILGVHQLNIPGNKAYREFSVGLDKLGVGKFKMFRLDYVRSYTGSSFGTHGLVFGLQLLNAFE